MPVLSGRTAHLTHGEKASDSIAQLRAALNSSDEKKNEEIPVDPTSQLRDALKFSEEERGEKYENVNKDKIDVAGRIHRAEYRQFWQEVAGHDKYVMTIIKHGFKLQFESEPDEYHEPNNASARANMDFVRESVAEMIDLGVVKRVYEKPKCVSPLTVAERELPDGSKKLRLCWDGSRMVNPCLRKESTKFADIHKALELREAGDYMFVYDLSKAFYHIKLHPDSKQYVAFELDGAFYQYEVVCFGLAPATAVITRITKPLCAHINAAGIRHSIFIDDGMGSDKSALAAEKARKFVYSTIQRAGFVLAEEKSDGPFEAAQVKKYLGMKIDTRSMTVEAPQDKLAEIKTLALEGLEERQPAKEKARVVGKIIATEVAMGKVVQILTKSAQTDIVKVTDAHGWKHKMEWSEQTKSELLLLTQNLDRFNGQQIEARHKELRVHELIQASDRVAVSDASATGTCAYGLKGDAFYVLSQLTPEAREASSGMRELLAVHTALNAIYNRGYKPDKHETLLWMTDSQNLVAFLTKGSMKPHIQLKVFEILELSLRMKIRIRPVHLRRDDPRIQLADAGSRIEDKDSWEIDAKSLARAEAELGTDTEIDLFADCFNKKKHKFASLFNYGGPEFIDAFSQPWGQFRHGVYLCPPLNLIIAAVKRIESEVGATGILVVPAWKSGYFWPFLFPEGRRNPRFKAVTSIRPELRAREWARPQMQGNHHPFLALKF